MDKDKKELNKEEIKEGQDRQEKTAEPELKMNDDNRENEKPEEKDNRSLGEKIEDGMDNVIGGIQDIIYGERNGMSEDVPATMPDPDNEIRHINKVQTRRNILRHGLGKRGWITLAIAFVLMLVIGFIMSKVG